LTSNRFFTANGTPGAAGLLSGGNRGIDGAGLRGRDRQ